MHVRIFRGASPAHAPHPLAAMFEDRKRLFVDLLGWDVPVVGGRYEIDAFDTSHCTYLVAGTDDEPHIGSMRLLPSCRPHLLDTLFPALVRGPVPAGPDVWEITRLCLPARFRTARRLEIRNALITAMVDHALGTGIATLTGVVTASYRAQVLAMGWEAATLGPAVEVAGATLGAFAIAIDAGTPARLAQAGIYPRPTVPAAAAACLA